MPLSQVRGLIAGGSLPTDALFWRQGMSGWLPASQIPELSGTPPIPIPLTPPPPPPPSSSDPFDSGRTMLHPSPVQPGNPSPSPTPWTPGQAPGSPSTNLRAGTLLDDRFLIIKRLGRGGMGVVYQVVDQDTEVIQ